MSKASEAALAIEHLHETVLDNGRGPKIKCMVAEAASSRYVACCMAAVTTTHSRTVPGWPARPPSPTVDPHVDPDNFPPRSRLFLVVPKTADATLITVRATDASTLITRNPSGIHESVSRPSVLQDRPHCCQGRRLLQVCTRVVRPLRHGACQRNQHRALPCVPCNHQREHTPQVAGYRVKCLLAEPKGKKPLPIMQGLDAPVRWATVQAPAHATSHRCLLACQWTALAATTTAMANCRGSWGASCALHNVHTHRHHSPIPTVDYTAALGTLLGINGMANASLMSQLQGMTPTPGAAGYDPAAAFAGQPSFAALAGLTMPYSQGAFSRGVVNTPWLIMRSIHCSVQASSGPMWKLPRNVTGCLWWCTRYVDVCCASRAPTVCSVGDGCPASAAVCLLAWPGVLRHQARPCHWRVQGVLSCAVCFHDVCRHLDMTSTTGHCICELRA